MCCSLLLSINRLIERVLKKALQLTALKLKTVQSQGRCMSNVGSLLNTGVAGIQKGLSDANRAAADIAKVGASSASGEDATSDITRAVVDLKSSELQVKASAQLVKTADDMLGGLIDTLA